MPSRINRTQLTGKRVSLEGRRPAATTSGRRPLQGASNRRKDAVWPNPSRFFPFWHLGLPRPMGAIEVGKMSQLQREGTILSTGVIWLSGGVRRNAGVANGDSSLRAENYEQSFRQGQ